MASILRGTGSVITSTYAIWCFI